MLKIKHILGTALMISALLFPAGQAKADPIHFGIVMIVTLAIGFLTPPVGVNLFVGCGIGKISIEKLSVAVLPFVLSMIVTLAFIAYIPQLSLCLLH